LTPVMILKSIHTHTSIQSPIIMPLIDTIQSKREARSDPQPKLRN
jgi:hypothetical protein